MMRIVFILLIISFTLVAKAQVNSHPQRSAADIAHKQTEMLVRELNITDSTTRDTLYRMHLKYAKKRTTLSNRDEILECMRNIQEELSHILTPAQYNAFMKLRLNQGPRSPQNSCNWLAPQQQVVTPASNSKKREHPTTQ
jgi:hypothetical protein